MVPVLFTAFIVRCRRVWLIYRTFLNFYVSVQLSDNGKVKPGWRYNSTALDPSKKFKKRTAEK